MATNPADVAEQLAAMFHEGAAANALALIKLQPDPGDVAAAISVAVNALYRSHRDVGNMLVAAHFGIAWCLGQASLQSDPKIAAGLKDRARAITFNVAANCWPGWDDEGVTIDDGHVAAGLALAGLCRELAQDLRLGAKALGKAQWLIGALELALGRTDRARAAFAEARRSFAAQGEDEPDTLMALAYESLAAKREAADSAEAARLLQHSLDRLCALGTKEGQFYADQIVTAERALKARSSI